MHPAIEKLDSLGTSLPLENLSAVLERKGSAIYFVGPRATVYEAIQKMSQHEVGALLVMDAGSLLGLISERDYARKVILRGKHSHDTLVEEIMSTPVVSASPSMTLRDGLRLMTDKRVRHLPVVDPANGSVLGVVSMGDLVFSLISAQADTLAHLTRYISGSY